MMFGLRKMQSFNAVRPNYWGRVYVLWKQSGCAASATLGFYFFANGLSLAQCVKPFDLFSLAGVGCLDEISYKI
jgi:multidrug transporter EmrE-like cation transporter